MKKTTIRISLEVDGTRYKADLAAAGAQTKTFSSNVKSGAASMNLLTGAARQLAGVWTSIQFAQLIKDSALLAARNETLAVVLDVVGRNAGYTKSQMLDTASAVAELGITTGNSRKLVVRMTQAHLDLADATKLARVAQDAAVVGNINSSEAVHRLIHGITTLQPEVLRNIGIAVSLEQEYADLAKTTGRTTDSFSQAEKQQIALNAVLREGGTLAGTYEEAMDTAGKQINSLARHAETASEELGKLFEPALSAGIKETGSFLGYLTDKFRGFNALFGTEDYSDQGMEALGKQINEVSDAIAELKRKHGDDLGSTFADAMPTMAGLVGGPGGDLKLLEMRLDGLLKKYAELSAAQKENASHAPLTDYRSTAAEAPAKTEDGTRLVSELKEQLALYGEISRVATLRYQMKNGALAELTRNEQAQSLELAKKLDLLDAQKAAEQERAALAKQAALDSARAADADIAAFEQMAELRNQYNADLTQQGASIYESTRTEQEQLAASLEELDRLLAENAISWDTYSRAVFDAWDSMTKAGSEAETLLGQIKSGIDGFAGDMSRAFADFALDAEKSFDHVAESFARMLIEMSFQQLIAQPLVDGIGNALAGKSTGNGAKAAPLGASYGVAASTRSVGSQPGSTGINVNLINNSSQPVSATKGSAKFDGGAMVIEVVLHDLNSGGRLDKELKHRGAGRKF